MTAVEGDTSTFTVVASSVESLPSGVTYDASGNVFTLDPTNAAYAHLAVDETQNVTVNYQVDDGNGHTVDDAVTFVVTGTNDTPTITVPDVDEGGTGHIAINQGGDTALAGISLTDPDTNDVQTVDFNVDSGTLNIDTASGVTVTINDGDHLQITGTATDISAALSGLHYNTSFENGGTDTLSISTTDGHGGNDIEFVTIDVNGHPVFGSESTVVNFAENGTGVVGTYAATDPNEGDAVSYTLSGDDAALFSVDESGAVTFIAAPDYETPLDTSEINTYHLTVVATDQNGASGSEDLTVTVTNLNEAATITAPESVSATEDTSFAFTDTSLISVSDSDAGTISVALSVTHGTLSDQYTASGLIVSGGGSEITVSGSAAEVSNYLSHLTYQDDANTNGSETLTITTTDMADGVSGSNIQTNTVTINVSAVEDAPTVSGGNHISINEGSGTISLDALANTVDADNDTLSVTNIDILPSGVTYDSGTHTFTLDADNAAFAHLAAGASQTVTVNYTVDDGHSGTVSDSVSFEVDGVNNAPVVSGNGVQGTYSATVGTGSVHSTNALSNATDVDDNTTLTVTGIGSLPAGVTYDSGTHQFTLDTSAYTYLSAGTPTAVEVHYNVSDGITTTADEVIFNVTGVNAKPVNTAVSTLLVGENIGGSNPGHTFTNLELAVSDANTADLQTVVVSVLHGALTETGHASTVTGSGSHLTFKGTTAQINSDLATLHYAPTANYTGSDTLTISDKDNRGATDVDLVRITIVTPPVFTDASTSFVTAENAAVTHALSATVGDSGSAIYSIVGGSESSAFSISGSTLTFNAQDYEAHSGHGSGSETFSVVVQATDAEGGHTSETITYTLTDVSGSPVFDSGTLTSATWAESSGSATISTFHATDPDTSGQTMHYTLSGDDSASFSINSATGDFHFASSSFSEGTYDVTVVATDTSGYSASEDVTITVPHTYIEPLSLDDTITINWTDTVHTSVASVFDNDGFDPSADKEITYTTDLSSNNVEANVGGHLISNDPGNSSDIVAHFENVSGTFYYEGDDANNPDSSSVDGYAEYTIHDARPYVGGMLGEFASYDSVTGDTQAIVYSGSFAYDVGPGNDVYSASLSFMGDNVIDGTIASVTVTAADSGYNSGTHLSGIDLSILASEFHVDESGTVSFDDTAHVLQDNNAYGDTIDFTLHLTDTADVTHDVHILLQYQVA